MANQKVLLKVGAPVWVFSRAESPTVVRVESETTRSWVLGNGEKVPKSFTGDVFEVHPKFGCTMRHCLTRSAADAMLLAYSRTSMSMRIKACTDPEVLRVIAAALGMPYSVEGA